MKPPNYLVVYWLYKRIRKLKAYFIVYVEIIIKILLYSIRIIIINNIINNIDFGTLMY